MSTAGSGHRVSGSECRSRRIVNLRRVEQSIAIAATGDEHFAVLKKRGAVTFASDVGRSRIDEGAAYSLDGQRSSVAGDTAAVVIANRDVELLIVVGRRKNRRLVNVVVAGTDWRTILVPLVGEDASSTGTHGKVR